ncbi:hypothetical protein D9615_006101 [Tricholomella constricta]|uniref:Uncharacterized protein n=1 Tax=Tricholomella constricta TaxID=117010 RepID=A0A8H5M4A0_9AGAR|nr:hypothetical protein D9615_006101 [Tricholomella constricta]
MNSSTVSSFFSRDVFLRRQARTRKRPTPTKLCPSTSSTNNPLAMIMEEEDEPRTPTASPSRSPSPGQYSPNLSAGGTRNPGVKSKRRHANLSVSDIRIAKTALVHDDHDFSQQSSALLSAPRPAPRPPVSPTPSPGHSPDPFSLRFHDGSLRFPHPPTPSPSTIPSYFRTGSESPTPAMSSCSPSTSPESRSNGLPTTPSSSDDEFSSYYSSPLPSFNPRRVSIKPLVITKHNSSSTPHDSLPSISTSLIEPFKNTHQECLIPSPYAPEEDSDSDSDSEWYNREISSVLTLCSPTSNFSQNSRPDSICVPVSPVTSPTPTSTPSEGVRGVQLDTPPCRRRSRISIPNYPPPPVPVVPEHLRSPPTTPSKAFRRSRTLSVTPPPRRPPPRSSIPADCVLVDEAYIFSDDSDSVFSFSLYDTSPTTSAPFSASPKSCYSQQSFQSPNPSPFPASFPSTPSSSEIPPPSADEEMDFPVDEVEFDMDLDRSMMLPLSIPNSPIDLEADIATGLEELRSAPQPQNLSLSVSDANAFTTGATLSDSPRKSAGDDDSRELRSRWSSSTLGSIREEHARRSGLGLAASAKLRAYFGSSPSPSPSPRSKSKSMSKSRGPASPLPSSRRSGSVSGAGSAIPLTPLTPTSPARRFRHARRESDVMAMGYGYYGLPSPGQPPLRRRGSVTPSVSDAGSEESASSAGSSGLRRKPIPVEMFLRSAA